MKTKQDTKNRLTGSDTAGLGCSVSVYTKGPPDSENWYTIWKNAVAVTKLCVSNERKSGTAYRLGEKTESNLDTNRSLSG